jgi:hypothetical protein
MDLISLYYQSHAPIMTTHMLLNIMSYISYSVTSTAQIIQFISTYNDPDYILFTQELEQLDLEYKLKLIELLIIDILKTHNPLFHELIIDENYIQIDITQLDNNNNIHMNESLKLALQYTLDISKKLGCSINIIQQKIHSYNKSYAKYIYQLSLKSELHNLKKISDLFDLRMKLFFEILKINNPLNHKPICIN